MVTIICQGEEFKIPNNQEPTLEELLFSGNKDKYHQIKDEALGKGIYYPLLYAASYFNDLDTFQTTYPLIREKYAKQLINNSPLDSYQNEDGIEYEDSHFRNRWTPLDHEQLTTVMLSREADKVFDFWTTTPEFLSLEPGHSFYRALIKSNNLSFIRHILTRYPPSIDGLGGMVTEICNCKQPRVDLYIEVMIETVKVKYSSCNHQNCECNRLIEKLRNRDKSTIIVVRSLLMIPLIFDLWSTAESSSSELFDLLFFDAEQYDNSYYLGRFNDIVKHEHYVSKQEMFRTLLKYSLKGNPNVFHFMREKLLRREFTVDPEKMIFWVDHKVPDFPVIRFFYELIPLDQKNEIDYELVCHRAIECDEYDLVDELLPSIIRDFTTDKSHCFMTNCNKREIPRYHYKFTRMLLSGNVVKSGESFNRALSYCVKRQVILKYTRVTYLISIFRHQWGSEMSNYLMEKVKKLREERHPSFPIEVEIGYEDTKKAKGTLEEAWREVEKSTQEAIDQIKLNFQNNHQKDGKPTDNFLVTLVIPENKIERAQPLKAMLDSALENTISYIKVSPYSQDD